MKTHYRKDMSGEKYGRWSVINYSHNVGSKTMWNCLCSCGNKKIIYSGHLKSGASKSCGCLRSEQLANRLFKHGLTGSRLQTIHTHMKQRCGNKSCKEYKHYGARGISVSKEFESFLDFKSWALSSGYDESLTIDRIDNNKGYTPENCRWVNSSIQNSNKRIAKSNTSGFVGVTERGGKWRARVDYEGKTYNIGSFQSSIDAAIARDSLVIKNNFPHSLNFNQVA